MTTRVHMKLAEDTWNLIKVILHWKAVDYIDGEMDMAAKRLIEIACDAAAQSERVMRGK